MILWKIDFKNKKNINKIIIVNQKIEKVKWIPNHVSILYRYNKNTNFFAILTYHLQY